MELPKNLVQMGKPDRIHKIFVEDYIMSYIKEWNRKSEGQPAGIALYGQAYKENNYKYYFMYGASRIEGLDRRGPYLSQSDREEINNVGNRYFEEYSFLGWCIVREELPETIFLDTRGKAMEINGYACFFEKNESMLNFMLEMDARESRIVGQTEPASMEEADDGNYRSLPVESRIAAAKKSATQNTSAEKTVSYKGKSRQLARHLQHMKMAAAAMFVVLCVIGITTLNDSDKIEEIQVAARQVIADLSQQKIPDAETGVETGTEPGATDVTPPDAYTAAETTEPGATFPAAENQTPDITSPAAENQTPNATAPVTENPTPDTVATVKTSSQPTSYTIMRGDTLNAICRRKYGTLKMVKQVCELNGIQNPNNIEVGQTILLP